MVYFTNESLNSFRIQSMQYSKFRNRGENSRSENSNPNGRKRTYTKENYFCFLRDEIGKNSVFPPAFSTAQKQNNTKIVHRVEAFTFHCSFSLVLNMAARPQRWGGEGEMLGLEIICTVPPPLFPPLPPPSAPRNGHTQQLARHSRF